MKTVVSLIAVLLVAVLHPIFFNQEAGNSKSGENLSVEIVRAKRFELVDDKDRVRIEMLLDDGNPVFRLKDENGKNRVVVFHQADATGVYVNDADEDTRVGIAQFPHGGGVAMHGAKGKGSAVYVLMNDTARLDVYDKEGKLAHRWPESK